MMPCASKVAIIGGGIAGLSCAISLSRAGIECHVFELKDPKEGASIGFTGRAAEALADLGIYDQVYNAGHPFPHDSTAGSMRDATGRLISGGPKRKTWTGAKIGVGVYRPTLIDIMTKTAKDLGVQYNTGVTFTSIDNRDDGVTVRFTNGETSQFDILIGADGISSATRQVIFPESPQPEYTGQISVRFIAQGPPIEDEGWYQSEVGRFGFYSLPDSLPGGPEGIIYVPSVLDVPKQRKFSDEEVRDLFTGLLESCTAPAAVELRRRLTPSSPLIARPFRWIMVPDSWYRKRVILVGDAAHATTSHLGMGGGMALEDAVVLGRKLGESQSCEDAFASFMQSRYERVKVVVDNSLALSHGEQQGMSVKERMTLISQAWATISEPY